jgi:protein-tyrosine sulfotransferase
LSKIEFSTDQVVKPVNLDALTSWVGKIPQDIMENMDIIAPMLGRLGYDPMANPPKYGEADLKIKENTENIRKNPEFWKNMEKKYSNLVTD